MIYGLNIDRNYFQERIQRQERIILEELGKTIIPEEIVQTGGLAQGDLCEMGGDPYGYEPELYFYQGDHLSSTQVVTDINGMVKQGILYAPFGEVITEYNAYWHQGKIPDYMFNAKELDEENGMYYYEARYYNPPMFISRDPLFEKKPWINPYAYVSNNPINRIDPTGMLDWEPEITTKGETQYKAEKGDSKETLKSQYGLSNEQASQIMNKAKLPQNGEISVGSKISGEIVESVTGSEVLKLDWKSPRATNQRKAFHTMFAILHSQNRSNNDGIVEMKDYMTSFRSMQLKGNFTIPVKGGKIPATFIDMTISETYSKLINEGQPFNYFTTSSGGDAFSQKFIQYPFKRIGIDRLMITIDAKYDNIYQKSYYR
jgi:RHS repeat-associated protein